MTDKERWEMIVKISSEYNWEPEFNNVELKESLKQKIIPEGFAHEVGRSIALFMNPGPFGWRFLKTADQAQQEEQNSKAHGRRLAQLRVLIAEVRLK